MIRKLFDIVFGSIVCMDCGKNIGSTDGEDSSGLCDKCYRARCSNGGNA